MEITQSGQQAENQIKKNESNVRDLWDNRNQANLRIIVITEEDKKRGIENIFEKIMTENFPNIKETDIKIQDPKQAEPKQTHTKHNRNGKSYR